MKKETQKETKKTTKQKHKATAPMKVGRPRVYMPDDLWTKFEEYVDWVRNNPRYICQNTKHGLIDMPYCRPLTKCGFCVFAGINQSTLDNYAVTDEYIEVIARVREIIDTDQLEGAMVQQYNPSITARVLKLADHTEVVSHTERERIEKMSDAEIQTEIKNLEGLLK